MQKKVFYVAYGNNLNLSQMQRICQNAEIVGLSELKNYQLLFRGGKYCSVATIEPIKRSTVPVLVWSLNRNDEADLDSFEEWRGLYHKEKIEVALDGVMIEAIIYIMNSGNQLGMPSMYYFNLLIEGYEDAGFNPQILEDALGFSKEFLMTKKTLRIMV